MEIPKLYIGPDGSMSILTENYDGQLELEIDSPEAYWILLNQLLDMYNKEYDDAIFDMQDEDDETWSDIDYM